MTHAKLLHYSGLHLCEIGARQCYDSFKQHHKDFISTGILFDADVKFLKKLLTKKHESIFEHCIFTFQLKFSRALLQELSRHRIGVSPSVKSTRYTLKKLIEETRYSHRNILRQKIIQSIDCSLPNTVADYLESVLYNLNSDDVNPDILKYFLPECWLTEGIYTINLRALMHLFELRESPSALPEFQELCKKIREVLPDEVKELLDCSKGDKK